MIPGSRGRVVWNDAKQAVYTEIAPVRAHAVASAKAAGSSARLVRSRRSGNLARDVSIPKPLGPLRSAVGSNLPYARKEEEGGEIRARRADRMLIRGTRTGAAGQPTASDFGAPIVASATVVQHRAKHYLRAGALRTYVPYMKSELRRAMPK